MDSTMIGNGQNSSSIAKETQEWPKKVGLTLKDVFKCLKLFRRLGKKRMMLWNLCQHQKYEKNLTEICNSRLLR